MSGLRLQGKAGPQPRRFATRQNDGLVPTAPVPADICHPVCEVTSLHPPWIAPSGEQWRWQDLLVGRPGLQIIFGVLRQIPAESVTPVERPTRLEKNLP